jgi:hypothetical protein
VFWISRGLLRRRDRFISSTITGSTTTGIYGTNLIQAVLVLALHRIPSTFIGLLFVMYRAKTKSKQFGEAFVVNVSAPHYAQFFVSNTLSITLALEVLSS